MSKYGNVAVIAAEMARSGLSPIEAWKVLAKVVFPTQPASRDKGCPKCAFLGLAEEGLIQGVSRGQYTKSLSNKLYAVEGVKLLRAEPDLAGNSEGMWERIMSGRIKKHNEQMSVVTALWKNRDIV